MIPYPHEIEQTMTKFYKTLNEKDRRRYAAMGIFQNRRKYGERLADISVENGWTFGENKWADFVPKPTTFPKGVILMILAPYAYKDHLSLSDIASLSVCLITLV